MHAKFLTGMHAISQLGTSPLRSDTAQRNVLVWCRSSRRAAAHSQAAPWSEWGQQPCGTAAVIQLACEQSAATAKPAAGARLCWQPIVLLSTWRLLPLLHSFRRVYHMHKPDAAWCMRHTLLNQGCSGSCCSAESSTIGCQQGQSPAAALCCRCGLLCCRLLYCACASGLVAPVQTGAPLDCALLLGGCSCIRPSCFCEDYLNAEVRCTQDTRAGGRCHMQQAASGLCRQNRRQRCNHSQCSAIHSAHLTFCMLGTCSMQK